MGMERYLFILVNKGLSAPVDNPTLMNLSKAMLLLQENRCRAVYVALNHLQKEEINAASKCITDIFSKELSQELMDKVFVSEHEGLYPEEFAQYMSGSPFKHICLQVLAIPHCREVIFQELDLARSIIRRKKIRVPLFFTPASQLCK